MGGSSSQILTLQFGELTSKTPMGENEISWLTLKSRINKVFTQLKDTPYKVSWKDPNTKEICQVCCDDEVKIALETMGKSPVFQITSNIPIEDESLLNLLRDKLEKLDIQAKNLNLVAQSKDAVSLITKLKSLPPGDRDKDVILNALNQIPGKIKLLSDYEINIK